MTHLQGAKYFTKLDLHWGYNNVRIKEGDKWKAAFKMNCGMFIPKVMFFGLCNSPAMFQSMMDEYFADYISEGWVINHLHGQHPHLLRQPQTIARTYEEDPTMITRQRSLP